MSDHPPVPVESLKKTALHAAHVTLGGKMVEFGGWHMPVQYGPILDEVRTVRSKAGLFDLSHMGRVRVTGEDRVHLVDRISTNFCAKIPEGGTLKPGNVAETVQLDEIFRAFDPKTRAAFRIWLDQQGRAFDKRGQALNDALGNLTPFEQDATTLLQILNEQKTDVRRLVANTGTVFDALT